MDQPSHRVWPTGLDQPTHSRNPVLAVDPGTVAVLLTPMAHYWLSPAVDHGRVSAWSASANLLIPPPTVDLWASNAQSADTTIGVGRLGWTNRRICRTPVLAVDPVIMAVPGNPMARQWLTHTVDHGRWTEGCVVHNLPVPLFGGFGQPGWTNRHICGTPVSCR